MPRPFHAFVPPMLPTLVERPPEADGWVHEIKFDGYRTQLAIDAGRVRAFTRNGYDWSDHYRPIVDAGRALGCTSAIIDGEVCVQAPDGRTDFQVLVSSIGSAPQRLIMFAFDLLELDGRDLRGLPLLDRRDMLQELLGPPGLASRLQFSPHHVGDGRRLFEAADAAGLEGIVSKRADSRYVSGRSDSWRKAKCFTVGEFEVIGVDKSSTGIPIALLGRPDGQYAGDAMIALRADERAEFWAAIERLGTPRARFGGMTKRKTATWVSEGLVARVRHLRGDAKLLRHATLQGLEVRDPTTDI